MTEGSGVTRYICGHRTLWNFGFAVSDFKDSSGDLKSAIRNPQSAIRNSKGIYGFSADKVYEAFAPSNHLHASLLDDHFGSARAGIIVGSKNHPIRSGVHHSQQVPFPWYLYFPIPCQEISGFADRADNVRLPKSAAVDSFRLNSVIGTVEAGAQKVVHSSIHHNEVLGSVLLCQQHSSH